MPRLRLFAGLREAAGIGEAEIAGSSVGEVLENAAVRFGDPFRAGLAAAQVWVNGDPAQSDTPVAAGDEVALIPPVSGGEQTTAGEESAERQAALLQVLYGVAAWGALMGAAAVSVEATAVAAAAVASLWALDVAWSAGFGGLQLSPIPAVLGAGLTAGASYGYGLEGFGAAVAGAVVLALLAVVIRPPLRPLGNSSGTLLIAVTSALLAGGFTVVRMRSAEESYVLGAVVGAAALAAWLVARSMTQAQRLDANLTAVVAGTVTGVLAGLGWGDSDGAVFLAAVAATAGFVAGRTAGGMFRLGYVVLAQQSPGYLAVVDGAFFATGAYWLVLALLGS